MPKSKLLLILAIFLILLTGIRLIWLHYQQGPLQPLAEKGILDLRNADVTADYVFTLKGEWEFYPNQFIMNNNTKLTAPTGQSKYIQVPGNWKSHFANDDSNNDAFGYGSYRLRILTPRADSHTYSLRIKSIATSSEIYANGRLIGTSGQIAEQSEEYTPYNAPYTVSFSSETDEQEIIIQAANFRDPFQGGISESIKFGTEGAVNRATLISVGTQLLVAVVLLVHVLYSIILYIVGTRRTLLIYFAIFLTAAILTILTADDMFLLTLVPLEYDLFVRIQYLVYLGAGIFNLEFIKRLLPEYAKIKVFYWYTIAIAVWGIFVLVAPLQLILWTQLIHVLLVLIPIIMVMILSLRTALKSNPDAVFIVMGTSAIVVNSIWGAVKTAGVIESGYYPVDTIAAILSMASYWFKQYIQTNAQTVKLADKLQQADKLKDDFLINTSHELRNPLHGILNIARSILDHNKRTMDVKSVQNLELLISVSRRMSYMLNDLIDLNRLKDQRVHLQLSSLSMQSVTAGVIDMLQFMTDGKPIQIRNQISASFPPVAADENRLIQILFNLIHNSIKFTDEGHIEISARIINKHAVIQIADTGIGMDKETLNRIFLPYEQGDSGITAIGGGIGVGLSICKQLIELHGGTIEADSSPGAGSTFTFSLPLFSPNTIIDDNRKVVNLSDSRVEIAASSQENSEAASGNEIRMKEGRPNILIVDDDITNLKIMEDILSMDGYNLVTSRDGHSALSLLDSKEWDLIIADVMMPRMSGYELTRMIRNRFSLSELPVLLLTARSRPEDVEAGFHYGANDYVAKPVDAIELRSRVYALTELKRSIHDRLRMEAAWLQAQIQPHFLFNTLNSVVALSNIDLNKMRALLEAFSHYLRASFDFTNSKHLVPIEHELDLVRSYLYIEKQRFEDRLNVIWEVDEFETFLIPPLSIQPLIENAIRHGILKKTGGGDIRIRIAHHEQYVEISVSDNGVGMNKNKLQMLFNRRLDSNKGVGLINTDRRLKHNYGAGLQITSKVGIGTRVSFRIPTNQS